MNFDIEHIGICVEKPIEMANCYRDILGFNIKFCAEDEEKGVAFITDGISCSNWGKSQMFRPWLAD
jgi:hypothetical protein